MQFNWPVPLASIPNLAEIPAGSRFGVSRTTTVPPHPHKGVDLLWKQPGAIVHAAQNGVIYKAYTYTALGGPGIIDIDHGTENGIQWRTRYLHVDPASFAEFGVKPRISVVSGQPIARVGNLASGAHLHFEIRTCNAACSWPTGWPAQDPLALLAGGSSTAPSLIFLTALGVAVYFLVRG